MTPGLPIDVRGEGLSRHLLDGWHAPESWGVWSAATTARVLLPLRDAAGNDRTTVRVGLRMPPSGGDDTALRVAANGVELAACQDAQAHIVCLEGTVDSAAPWLLLELHVGDLRVPAALGVSQDQRALGVGLVRVEVDRAAANDSARRLPDPAAVEWVPATELLHPQRLDLVLKARFFRALVSGRGVPLARDAYLRHIVLRTHGQEPADYLGRPSAKRELAHFEWASRALLMSMQTEGFDAAHPVPLDTAGRPLNGAHRIACAAALLLDVAVRRETRSAGTWDMAWFDSQGYGKRDKLRLLFDLARLAPQRCSVFVLWPQVVDRWNDIVAQIGAAGYAVAGHVDLAWPEAQRPACESLVYDLYSHGITDFAEGFGHIDRKLQFLRTKPCFLRVGVCMVDTTESAGWPGITALKAGIRERCAASAPVDQFVTCHFGDTPAESQHMARTMLCPENLDAAAGRQTAQPRPAFLRWINDYVRTLAQLGIDSADCCIVGSAALEVQGIRLATDIDFTVREGIRASRFTPGVTRFDSGVDLVTQGYHRSHTVPPIADDELIDEPGVHVYFRGLKITPLTLIRDRKAFSARPKDLLDVELIDAAPAPRLASLGPAAA